MSRQATIHAIARQADADQNGSHRLEKRTDDELMLLARSGMTAAFDLVVRRHQAKALKVAYRYSSDRSEAQDAVQNAFLDIFRHLPNFRPMGKFERYLHRVVLNQCRSLARSGRSRERTSSALLQCQSVTEPVTSLDSILNHEHQSDLKQALSKLSHKHRETLALRFGAELSYREIGDMLDIPLGTVKSRITKALARLQRALPGELR